MKGFKASGGAMFVRTELFKKIGGYDTSLNYGGCSHISKKLRKAEARYALLPCSVMPSLRRFEEHGYAKELVISAYRFIQGQAQPL